MSTGHPAIPEWIGSKLRLVVLNQMDKISEGERTRWASYFTRAANTRVVFTNGRSGEGVPRLMKLALTGASSYQSRARLYCSVVLLTSMLLRSERGAE